MKYILFLFVMTLLISCQSADPKTDEDVAAIVKGKDITVKDLRSLYPVDDDGLKEMVENFVKEELVVLEAKKMGFNISDETENLKLSMQAPDYGGNAELFESQSEYLDISVEEYFENYFIERIERGVYVNKYFNEIYDLQELSGEDEINETINLHLENLLYEYDDEIEIMFN